MRAFRRLVTGLVAFAGIVLLVAGAPLLLAKVGGDPLPRHPPSLGEIGDALASPDDGSLFVKLLTILGWLAWATVTVSLLVEIVARLRGRSAVRLPGLRLQQRVAAALVGAVLAVFLGGSLASAAAPASRPIAVVAQRAPVAAVPPVMVRNAAAAKAYQQIQRPVYVVKRGDYLGRIAQRFTGDFDRYRQIAALNPRLIRNPNAIQPGWKLVLPVDSRDRGTVRHATGHLVKPAAKAAVKPSAPTASAPVQPAPPVTSAPPSPADTGTPTKRSGNAVLATIAGLAAASVLAGQVALWRRRTVRIFQHRVRSRRVTQVRYPVTARGVVPISPAPAVVYEPPPERPGGHDRLDAGLRRLALGLRGRATWAMPDIYAAWHYGGELGVVLTGPCSDPPEPYSARSPDTWSLSSEAALATVDGTPALLPGLLTLGTWPEGGELYVDSERTGLLTLTGDPERCDNLLRHLAAEAATAAWADSAAVFIAGFGSADTRALGSLNENRVRAIGSVPDALSRMARRAVVNRAVLRESDTADTMIARINSTSGSMWTTHVLFVSDPWGEHSAQLEELDAQLSAAGRVGVSIVATHPTTTRWSAGVTAAGSLDMPWLAFSDTVACQLTSEQLGALSAAIGNPAYAGVPIAGARHRQRAA
jgi:LysM repeat protein